MCVNGGFENAVFTEAVVRQRRLARALSRLPRLLGYVHAAECLGISKRSRGHGERRRAPKVLIGQCVLFDTQALDNHVERIKLRR